MATPNTCATCAHWHAKKSAARVESDVGECRANTPVRDFAWARTKATDGCAQHQKPKLSKQETTAALPLDAVAPREPENRPAIAQTPKRRG